MFNSRKIILIAAVLVFMFAALLVSGFYLFGQIQSLSGELAVVAQKIALLDAKTKNFSDSAAAIQDLRPEISALEGSFVSKDGFVNLIRRLEYIAKQSNVSFNAENANIPADSASRPSISFQISGDSQELINFFSLLDKIQYFGIVDKLSIIREGDIKKPAAKIDASVDYLIFNFKQ